MIGTQDFAIFTVLFDSYKIKIDGCNSELGAAFLVDARVHNDFTIERRKYYPFTNPLVFPLRVVGVYEVGPEQM